MVRASLGAMSGLVVAALSGGVDSATAAALLVEQGHRVVGMTMRLYDARGTRGVAGGRCCGPRDIEDARAVCAHLGIPLYVVDLAAEFGAAVVEDFVEAYLAGETPNPCVKCNQHIKFTPLLERARAIGADVLVTGHYAQIAGDGRRPGRCAAASMRPRTSRTSCSRCRRDELAAVRFPLGGMTKDEVRAPRAPARAAERRQGRVAGDLLRPRWRLRRLRRGAARCAAAARCRPRGAIVDDDGAVLGRHDGTHQFTVGQHRGLGNLTRAGQGGIPTSCYVTAIDPARGEVRVGPREAAERRELALRDLRWLSPPRAALDARGPGPPPRHADRGRRSTIAGATARGSALADAHGRRARPGRGALRRRSRARRRLDRLVGRAPPVPTRPSSALHSGRRGVGGAPRRIVERRELALDARLGRERARSRRVVVARREVQHLEHVT